LFQRFKIWMISQKWFWSSQTRLKRVLFWLEVGRYKRSVSMFNLWNSSKILSSLLYLALKSVLGVSALLAMLLFAEVLFGDVLSVWTTANANGTSDRIDQLRLFAQLLTAVFSIYFATIGIILSAGHSGLRRDIVQLLTAEQVGSRYSKTIVISAAFCVAASSLPVFGIEPGILVLAVAVILTLATTLTLFPLGQRLFNFFDLSPLIPGEIVPRITRQIDGAVRSGNSDSLANHYSKETERLLEQLAYIDERLKADTSALESNLPTLTDEYARLLLYYLRRKHLVQRSSYWFPRRHSHPQWFFAGDTATTMALNTGSQLQPQEVPRLDWFEDHVIQKLKGHIQLALEKYNYELTLLLLGRLAIRASMYAQDFHIEVGMKEIEEVRSVLVSSIATLVGKTDSKREKTITAISDTWVAIGSNLGLETLRRMMTFEKELDGFFAADVWNNSSLRTLPWFLKTDTSFIVERIDFELKTEGRRLSQPKYLRQLMVQELLKKYRGFFQSINDFQLIKIPDFAQTLIKAKMPAAATQVVLVSFQTYWKMPKWLVELSALLKRYYAYQHFNEEQYVLPRLDIDLMVKNYARAHKEAITSLTSTELVEHVLFGNEDEDLPDHFGQIYYQLAEECVRSLEANEIESFKSVVRAFVPMAIVASDYKFADPSLAVSTEFRLHLISATIQDLACVLGYAIIYGEYHKNPKLSEVALNEFFSRVEKIEDKRSYFIRMLRLADTWKFSSSASPRNIHRINWKMAFERRARGDGFDYQFSFGRGNPHPSPFVDAFLSSHAEPSKLFFASKIVPLIGKVDFELDHEVAGFVRRLNEKKGGSKK
jgi:hypothetical protein